MSGVSKVDELLEMSRKMKERLEHLGLKQDTLVDRLCNNVRSATNTLTAAAEVLKV